MLKLDPKNTVLLEQKQRLLAKALEETEEKAKTLRKANEQAAESVKKYDAWKKAYDPIQKEIEETGDKITKLKAKMSEMKDAGEVDTEEYQNLKKELADSTVKLRDLRKEAEKVNKTFDNPISQDQYEALQRELIETENQAKSLEGQLSKLGSKDVSTSLKNISDATGKFGKGAETAGKALMPVTAAIGAAGTASVVMATNFEDSMSQAAGALDLPMSKMDGLRELAIQVGQDTIFSATEAGNAITELAKGGLSEADIQAGALQTTMDLAAASGMDLGSAANTVVQAMGAFGLSAGESAEAANALAGAAAASSTDVEPLTEGLAQCSAQAKNAGWDIQETTAVLGKFADAGITGSDAGTSLKTMLQRLAAPTDKAAKTIEELGIQTRDSSGNMLGASDMAEELQTKLGGLSAAERDAALQTIFGSDATRAATVMMNSGTEGLEKYIKATNDQEAAQRMANSQMGETSRAIEEAKGSLETAAIAIGSVLAPIIQKAAALIAEMAQKFANASPGVQKLIMVIAGVVAAIGPLLIIIGKISTGISAVTSIFSGLTAASGGLGAALAGLAGPIAVVVAAIVGLIAIFATLWNTNESFRQSVSNVWAQVQTAIQTAISTIQGIFSAFVELVNVIWTQWGDTIMQVVQNTISTITTVVNSGLNIVKNLIQLVTSVLKGDWSGAWNAAKAIVQSALSLIRSLVTSTFNNIVVIIRGIGSKIGSAVRSAFDSAISFLTSLPSKAVKWGSDFIDGIVRGIKGAIGKVTGAVKDVADKISSFLHFSRPDEGPLHFYEKWMPDMMKGLAKGIYDYIPEVQKAAKAAAATINYEIMRDTPTQTIDYDMLYNSVRRGASDSNIILQIGERECGRALKGMGVAFV